MTASKSYKSQGVRFTLSSRFARSGSFQRLQSVFKTKLLFLSTRLSRSSTSARRNGMVCQPTITATGTSFPGGFQPAKMWQRSQLHWKVVEERPVRKHHSSTRPKGRRLGLTLPGPRRSQRSSRIFRKATLPKRQRSLPTGHLSLL